MFFFWNPEIIDWLKILNDMAVLLSYMFHDIYCIGKYSQGKQLEYVLTPSWNYIVADIKAIFISEHISNYSYFSPNIEDIYLIILNFHVALVDTICFEFSSLHSHVIC